MTPRVGGRGRFDSLDQWREDRDGLREHTLRVDQRRGPQKIPLSGSLLGKAPNSVSRAFLRVRQRSVDDPLQLAKSSGVSRQSGDGAGLFLTYGLLVVQPFHAELADYVPYYREVFALGYILLLLPRVRSTLFRRHSAFRPGGEIFLLLLFGLLLIFYAFIDPEVNLYGAIYTEASERLATTSPRLYVIRNALLYLPMVIYIAVRGLRRHEVSRIALVSALVAPISVWVFIATGEIASLSTIGIVATLGGAGLDYNSYVPYLTFPIAAALYLALDSPRSIRRLLFGLIGAVLISFAVASTSRQSVLFVIIAAALFSYRLSRPARRQWAALLIGIGIVGGLVFWQIHSDYGSLIALSDEYGSIIGSQTPRLQIALDGLRRLNAEAYFGGIGLSSVIVSGPHNDYIRWLQRIGMAGAIAGFLPFLVGLRGAIGRLRSTKDDHLMAFIVLAVGFTIFHSFFGYPREDAFQALYSFLGLGLWLGYRAAADNEIEVAPQYHRAARKS